MTSSRIDFLSPLSTIPGFGEKRIAALRANDINTIGDLLYTLPLRHIDRSRVVPIGSLHDYLGQNVAVVGTVDKARVEQGSRRKLRIMVKDDTGSFECLWFAGITHFQHQLTPGKRLLFSGKVNHFVHLQMVHPATESIPENADAPVDPFLPRYSLTETMREAGIGQAVLIKAIKWILDHCEHWPRVLPDTIEAKHAFPPLDESLRHLHFPLVNSDIEAYRDRLAYEELWQLAVGLRWSRRKFELPGRKMSVGDLPSKLLATLPFTLSPDQQSAIATLAADSALPQRMHRLLMGDVGSGKTITALFACLPALNSRLQVAWLAPTEILARQSYSQIKSYLEPLGFSVGLITSSTGVIEKRTILEHVANRSIHILVGTHSLLQPTVRFAGLGQIVIDEQHKFGVDQRRAMQMKDPAADFLLLSATPIPQTLAETVYGDLEPVVIKTAHHTRTNVTTKVVPAAKRDDMYAFIAKEISSSDKRAFVVVPRIESDEDEGPDGIDVIAKNLAKSPLAKSGIAIAHGQQKPDERECLMQEFRDGKHKTLIATTVIEVGIDIPQASCIVIEGAEWFGLSQLHQLRGRVGRNGSPSWCFLLTGDNADEEALERLRHFAATSDGFAIAELDLSLRGPGSVGGVNQTGFSDLRFADILRDAPWFKEINAEVKKLLVD